MKKPAKDSLVLYKNSPALVITAGDKIDIRLPDGRNRSVRKKDVFVLHPGPAVNFPDLESGIPEGAPREAWELLQGGSPSLADLAELVYGNYSPGSAWAAFKLLNRTPWFRGTVKAIEVVDPASVKARIEADRKKAEADKLWADFIERFKHKAVDRERDELFLRDLEMYALGRSKGSRILKTLGKTQSPENAHRLLLAKGVVDSTWNPHPQRLEVSLETPSYALADMAPVERLDLTSMEAFAIDDEGNEDPDDAVAWDGDRFWVHVADAAGLISMGSEADANAREQASSLYLPEKITPMLPPEAARRLGLGLAPESPALSYAFRYDAEGRIVEFSIHLTTVRVSRMTYAQANERIHEEPFATIKRLTDAFRASREAAGAVSIRMPEVKIRLNAEGKIIIEPLMDIPSRDLVSEAMLMTGRYTAAWCREKGIPIPYAVQDRPDSRTEGKTLKGLAAEFAKRRGMKRSRTTLECSPHAGLGLDCYSRVTSPLRRYPDLIASRQIRNTILGQPIEDTDSVLAGLAAFESRTGSLIQAERRSNLFWKLQWLDARPGYRTEAVLLDQWERQGLFLIVEIALEVRVALKKTLAVGERATLKLREVDIPESSALFIVDKA